MTRAEQVRAAEQAEGWGKWYSVRNNKIDVDKFVDRYGLKESEFQVEMVECQVYVRVKQDVKLPDDPPIFEAPEPEPPPKTREDYLAEFVASIVPDETDERKAELAEILHGAIEPEKQARSSK